MKQYVNITILLVSILMLVACSHTPVSPTASTEAMPSTETSGKAADVSTMQPMTKQPTGTEDVDPEITSLYQKALDLMSEEKFDAAEQILQKITTRQPELAGPYVNLGIIYQQRDRPAEAEYMFKQAIEHKPHNVIAYNQLGILYRKGGRFDEAIQVYNKALEIDPLYTNACLNLGILYDLYLDRPRLALVQYQRYQQLVPDKDKQVDLWIQEISIRLKQSIQQSDTGQQ